MECPECHKSDSVNYFNSWSLRDLRMCHSCNSCGHQFDILSDDYYPSLKND